MGEGDPIPEAAAPLPRRRRRLPRWIGDELSGADATAFVVETSERDVRRIRVLAPMMLVLHVAPILFFWRKLDGGVCR